MHHRHIPWRAFRVGHLWSYQGTPVQNQKGWIGRNEVTHIPMLGTNSPMNVAMACAIATFEIIGRSR